VLLAWRIQSPVALAAISWIAVLGIALVYIDIAVHRLPDRLTFLAFGGALVMFGIGDLGRLSGALLCCLALASGYLLMSLTSGGGLGLGDGKFALSLGLALGWFGWFATLYGAALGFVFAGLFAIVMLVAGRLSWTQAIPHGPFMLLGALVAILTTSG
jgi:leader peptidase (prepilin peptidase)/N-methyltransferase